MLTTIFRTSIDVIAQYFAVFYAPIFVFWLIIHLNIEYWRGKAKKAYWTACLAWPAITGPLLFYKDAIFAVRWNPPGWMIILGTMILIFGSLFGWRTFRNVPLRTIIGLPELAPSKNAQPLLHHGIYSRTRNPIYLTHTTYIVGLTLVTGFAANWALLALDIMLLPLTILAEEGELIRRYGPEYVTYMRRVPRFFPRWPW